MCKDTRDFRETTSRSRRMRTGNSNNPPTPSGQGYILRTDATPQWTEYFAATTGAPVMGDGTDVVSDLTPDWQGKHTFSSDLDVAQDVGHKGDGDTYLRFTTDQIDLVAGGNTGIQVTSAGYVDIPSRLRHDGDADTYLLFTSDQIDLLAGGTTAITINSTGYVDIPSQLRHIGDTDTYMVFNTDEIEFFIGGAERLHLSQGFLVGVSGYADALVVASNGDITLGKLGAGIVASSAGGNLSVSSPGTLSASSSNSSSGNHTHAITAPSGPGASEAILKTTAAGHIQVINCYANYLGPTGVKSSDIGSGSAEWDNIYYVTANEGTSRLLSSTKICPVCSAQMSKGTGGRNILGENADYETVFCTSCGVMAVEERSKHTPAMLANRRPPSEVRLADIRTKRMGGHDFKVMIDFDYGNGVTNSTRLGDDELDAMRGMTGPERKAFLLQLGEREWYAREEGRLMNEHAQAKHNEHRAIVAAFLNTDLMR